MTLTQLEYVIALYRRRHFMKAAKDCHVEQPTLSMQIKKLEEELGEVLFDRSQNPVKPTDVGERFVAQALVVLHEVKKLNEVLTSADVLDGDFKIGIIPGLAPSLLPLFLGPFIKKYPKVKLSVEELQTHQIIEKLKADEIDAGLLATPLKDNQIIERVLYYEEFLLLVGPGHKLLSHKKIDEADIQNEFVWLMDEGHCLRNQVLKLCSHRKKKDEVQFKGGSLETIKNLVLQGEHLAILPQMACQGINPKFLKVFKSPVPTREISLVSSRAFLREKHLDALEEIIIDVIPAELSSPKRKTPRILSPL